MAGRKAKEVVAEVKAEVKAVVEAVKETVSKDSLKDLLEKAKKDPNINSALQKAVQDVWFTVAGGANAQAKYDSWKELDKAFDKIVATNEVLAVANAIGKFLIEAVLLNWKKIQPK